MIAAIKNAPDRKETLTLTSRHVNGCETPSKSSSSETNNTDNANQLTSTNSISSNETVIVHPEQLKVAATALKNKTTTTTSNQLGTLANGTKNGDLQAQVYEDDEMAPTNRQRGNKTLRSLFIQFASNHLNLFQHNNNENNNSNNATPTKLRANQHSKRASNQLVAEGQVNSATSSCASDKRPATSSTASNNFLVSFAHKCFHLNFSSSNNSSALSAGSTTSGRNCHSCPVTPIKQPAGGTTSDLDEMTTSLLNGQSYAQHSNGGGALRLRSLLGSKDDDDESEPNQITTTTTTGPNQKRPQVRFVVESTNSARRQNDKSDESSQASDRFGGAQQDDRTSESVKRADNKQRCGYFMINKHIIRPNKQTRAKQQNDCASQTTSARSLLENQTEFIEDDEKRAKLVELLFKLPEMGGGGGGGGGCDELNLRMTARDNCGQSSDESSTTTSVSQRQQPMNSAQFRDYGYLLIDYICNYLDTIRQRRVTPINIEPGYLKSLIKPNAPEQGEPFSQIMRDFENHIMCGITHWQHPHFHAYFPAGNAYPSILADMLSDALGCMGFSWAASPAYTELEIIMLDWMGKMIGLPDEFLCLASSSAGATTTPDSNNNNNTEASTEHTSASATSRGGGVIQGSASECVLVSMLAARHWAMDKLRKRHPNTQDGILLTKLIGYCSKEAHSCVEKAAMIGFIRMRTLETDERYSLRGETLRKAIEMDLQQGLEPFIVCATLGTTSCVSFDNLRELGEVCRDHDNLWLHVDAAYAGSALICPEFKYLIDGIELATSINMNPNKWMLINFDCSLMWVKDRFKLTRAFVVDPLYLQHSFSDQAIDYRHWGIPLSRRFRALKLWFVIRSYGVEGLREYIRNHVRLAKLFETLIREDKRFMITNEVTLGLVCFRLIGSNALNQRLLSMLNASGKLHMVPASLNGRYIIRFCVCDQNAKAKDIHYAYECISEMASELFELIKAGKERIRAISQQNTIDVSSISLHTQQSASADRLSGGGGGGGGGSDQSNNQQVAAVRPPVSATGQPLLRRSSTRRSATATTATSTTLNGEINNEEEASGRSPVGARSPKLMKQASIRAAGEHNRPVSGLSNGGTGEHLEDLEQEVPIDSLATIDGCDFDLEDELEEELLEELQAGEHDLLAGASGEAVGTALLQADETELDEQQRRERQQLISIMNDSISPIQRGRLSRASNSVRSSSTRATAAASSMGEDADEAADELVKLANKRNRMSLRYKREFFVRVVSDPRVYRASISGDINAHTSSTSSLASQPTLVGPSRQQSSGEVGSTRQTAAAAGVLTGQRQQQDGKTLPNEAE